MSNHSEREHSEVGGSSAHIWPNCQGYVFLKRQLPAQLPTPAMLKGTRDHEFGEKATVNFLTFKETGQPQPPISSYVPSDTVPYIQTYVDLLWTNGLEQTITGKAWGVEERFVIDAKLQMFGSIDFWSVYTDDKGRRVGLVVDFKSGVQEVAASKNAQLAFYALGLREFVRTLGKDLDIIRAVIIQPKSLTQDYYKETKFTPKQLDSYAKKFFKAAHQVYVKQKPKFKVGEWCGHCPAQGGCAAYMKSIEARTELMLTDPEEVVLPSVETVSVEIRERLLKHKEEITAWLDKIQKYEFNLQLHNQGSPNFKIVRGRSNRKWIKDEDAIIKALSKTGLAQTEFLETKLKAFGPIEKKLGEKSLDKLLIKPDGKPTLVPIDDPRQKVDQMALLEDLSGDDEEEE